MIRVAVYVVVHRLASCMVGMIKNLGRSLCIRSLLKFSPYLQLFSVHCPEKGDEFFSYIYPRSFQMQITSLLFRRLGIILRW